MIIVARFPDYDNLIDSDVAALSVGISQMQYSAFYFNNISAQARWAAAVDINSFADEFWKKVIHCFSVGIPFEFLRLNSTQRTADLLRRPTMFGMVSSDNGLVGELGVSANSAPPR